MDETEVAVRKYAHVFAADPKGARENNFEALSAALGGNSKAASIDSLCWFLHCT